MRIIARIGLGLAVLVMIGMILAFAAAAGAEVRLVTPADDLQHVLRSARAGDEIILADGDYAGGVRAGSPGTRAKPIVFRAQNPGQVTITGGRDALSLFGCHWWTVEGITATGAERCGIYVSNSANVTIRRSNGLRNGVTGILTAFCPDILVEGGEFAYNREQHGIYVSNSADRPVIVGNNCHDNGRCGIQVNGDWNHRKQARGMDGKPLFTPASEPIYGPDGDGIIEGAVVRDNTCARNGRPGGGASIQFLAVCRSEIARNVITEAYNSGIALSSDQAGNPRFGSSDNVLSDNVVTISPTTKRACILVNSASVRNTYTRNTLTRGASPALDVRAGSEITDGGGNTVALPRKVTP